MSESARYEIGSMPGNGRDTLVIFENKSFRSEDGLSIRKDPFFDVVKRSVLKSRRVMGASSSSASERAGA